MPSVPPAPEDDQRVVDLRPPPLPDDAAALALRADVTLHVTKGVYEGSPALWWTANSPHLSVTLADEERRTPLDAEPEKFATLLKAADKTQTPGGFYLWLIGAGRRVADLIPRGVQAVLRQVAGAVPGRPLAVLLVSEEAAIPWELAYLEPPLPGMEAASPFLCGQVALGRWVTSARQLEPPTSGEVGSAAIVTAEYLGVQRWDPSPPPWPRRASSQQRGAPS